MAHTSSISRSERGCLPFTNCLVTVPQDRVYAAELFGSFNKMIPAGLGYAGLDCCGMCITLRSVSNRVEQLNCAVSSKTKDNVFVNMEVAVHFAVAPMQVQDAMYKLSAVDAQIDSYVSDVVRSQLPKLTLDEAFESKDAIAKEVESELQKHMTPYGWQVHKALVIELQVNQDVMASMNEINKQKRLRDASIMAAEAEKIKIVKAAEADADAAQLAGEGIARQRGAIVDGLRASIAGSSGGTIDTEDISSLLLVTQYFETLKDIGSHQNCKAYLMPKDDPDDVEQQIRLGMLQGEAALEFLQGGRPSPRGAPRPPPQQQIPQDGFAPPALQSSASFAQDFEPEPPPKPAPKRTSQQRNPGGQVMQLQVPPGVGPGATLQIQAPDGRVLQIQVPPGVQAGQTIQIQV